MKNYLFKIIFWVIVFYFILLTPFNFIFAQSFKDKFLNNTKELITTKTQPLIQNIKNFFTNLTDWINKNISFKLKLWWESKARTYLLSLWYQFLIFLDKEIWIR